MPIQSILVAAASIVLLASVLGCTTPCTCPRMAAHPSPPSIHPTPRGDLKPRAEQGSVVRFDFVFTAIEEGKPDSTSKYTLNLEENHQGELTIGSNVALSTQPRPAAGDGVQNQARPPQPSQARMDVGLKIRGLFNAAGDNLLLHTNFEASSLEEPSTIRKVVASNDTLVPPGKSTLVASLEDPASHKRFQVTVTATKLP